MDRELEVRLIAASARVLDARLNGVSERVLVERTKIAIKREPCMVNLWIF